MFSFVFYVIVYDYLFPQAEFKKRVMSFQSNGEREFLEDDELWGSDGPLRDLKIQLILTDKPYGMLKCGDGTSQDQEIPEADIATIVKRYSHHCICLC